MDVQAPRGLLRAFAQLPDPRMDRTKRHRLEDILTIAICPVICSADGWPLVATAAKLLDYIRGHWGIENRLHWSLDVNFREDDRRIRQGHAAENFSRLSRIALNLLKAETTCRWA